MAARLGLSMVAGQVSSGPGGKERGNKTVTGGMTPDSTSETEYFMAEEQMRTMVRAIQEVVAYPVRVRAAAGARRVRLPADGPSSAPARRRLQQRIARQGTI